MTVYGTKIKSDIDFPLILSHKIALASPDPQYSDEIFLIYFTKLEKLVILVQ